MPDPSQDPSQAPEPRLQDVMGGLGQPAATASPLANPSNDTFGTILRYVLPAVAAVAAGSNPALARGVQAASGVMDLQQGIAERQQKLNLEKRQNDLQNQRLSSLSKVATDPDHYTVLPDGTRLKTAMDMYATAKDSSSPTHDTGDGSGPGPLWMNTDTPNANPALLNKMHIYNQQGAMAMQMGDPNAAQTQFLAAQGLASKSSPSAFQSIPLNPGDKLEADTLSGKMERSVPPTDWQIRQGERVVAPQGTVGPNGEDLSGKASLTAIDKATGSLRYLGEHAVEDKTPSQVLNDPKSTPEQKAMAERVLRLEHPGTMFMPESAGGLGMTKPVGAKDTNARADKSYQFSVTQLNKLQDPIDSRLQRLSTLQDTINQRTPQADALVAPELLTVMAGGQGSGLRMNEAEISRVVGGRTNLESLKAALNKWQVDPSKGLSITPAQRQQIQSLVGTVNTKLQQKRSALEDAHEALIGTDDPSEHRGIVNGARKALTTIDAGSAAGGAPASSGGSNPAPMGTIVNVNGAKQIKTENGWQPYRGQ